MTLAFQADGTAKPARLESLDALRGISALSVAWFHIFQKSGEFEIEISFLDMFLDKTSAYGWLGVPIFFIITGYVIPYTTFRHPQTIYNAWAFIRKRFFRLYPPFAATVVLTVILAFVAPLVPGFSGEWPMYLDVPYLGINALLITPLFEQPWLVPVFWSLAVEAQYYLLICAIVLFRARWDGPHLAIYYLLFACALSVLLPYNLHSLVSHAPLFVIGHALYRRHIEADSRWVTICILIIACAATAVALGPIYLTATIPAIWIIAARIRFGTPVLFLGLVSYSIYLIHYPIGTRAVRLFARVGSGDFGIAMTYLCALVLVIVAAWLFYLLVERPSMRASANILYRTC